MKLNPNLENTVTNTALSVVGAFAIGLSGCSVNQKIVNRVTEQMPEAIIMPVDNQNYLVWSNSDHMLYISVYEFVQDNEAYITAFVDICKDGKLDKVLIGYDPSYVSGERRKSPFMHEKERKNCTT